MRLIQILTCKPPRSSQKIHFASYLYWLKWKIAITERLPEKRFKVDGLALELLWEELLDRAATQGVAAQRNIDLMAGMVSCLMCPDIRADPPLWPLQA